MLQTDGIQTSGSSNLSEVRMDDIQPNPNQPRSEFDDDSLQELANSIRQIGIIQPITLRDMGDGTYIIIAGERRWRASQRVGLTTIPAYIRTVDDENMLEMALVENIQREDLTAIEVALAYHNLIEQYSLTQDQLSERVGKNRTTIANYLRLLKLPASVLHYNPLAKSHFAEMKKAPMSVRQIESMAKQLSEGGSVKAKSGKRIRQKGSNLSADYNLLREGLRKIFRTKVEMTCSQTGKGKISIPFANESELERIIEMFDKLRS